MSDAKATPAAETSAAGAVPAVTTKATAPAAAVVPAKPKEPRSDNPDAIRAVARHHKKYNCAQAVACSFCERLGRNEKEVFQLMEGFGFGMGSMETCGAVSAMAAVVGMKESDGNLDNPASKKRSYRAAKELIRRFEEKNGSVICRQLKGVDTKKVLRSCNGCVEDAAELVGRYLNGEFDAVFEEAARKEAAKETARKATKEAAAQASARQAE